MVTVRWTGAAGLEFTHEGRTVLVDPYFSRKRKIDLFFRRLAPDSAAVEAYLRRIPGALSAVIVGHTHFDHVMDVPEIARRFPGPVVGSRSADALLARHGMPGRVQVCNGGERIELPGGDAVTMIPSRHGRVALGRVPYPGEIVPAGRLPMKAGEYGHGTVFAPRLELGGITFLDLGSADFVEQALSGQRCDVLFLCVPGWKRVPDYVDRVPSLVRPRVIVPMHFDDFTRPLAPDMTAPRLPFQGLPAFLERLSASSPGVEVRLPQTFEPMNFA